MFRGRQKHKLYQANPESNYLGTVSATKGEYHSRFINYLRKSLGTNKWLSLVGLIALAALAIGLSHHSSVPRSNWKTSTVKSEPVTKTPPVDHPDRIRVLAAGDFIAHDSINANAKQADGSYNYLPMMNSFSSVFQGADIRFCNDANLNGGPQYGISGYPKFNSPTEFARDMAKLGCNMINVATNHSFDRNQAAINSSIDAWDKNQGLLAVVGHNRDQTEHDTVHYFSIKGVKFAFLAYTTYLNTDAPAQNDYGVNVYSDSFAAQQINAAKANGAQVIIVSIRWGVEYSPEVSASQKQTAQFLADSGVSLILGHGSHVLEPVQQLVSASGNKTIVWYSLGNFLNTQLPPETLFNGLAVIDYSRNTKQIADMGFLPIYMHYEWTASQAKSQDLLARHNIKMYSLDEATQAEIDAQQLSTTVAQQRTRLNSQLNTYLKIPLINQADYFK